jgi:hypothetical protein
LTPFEQITPDTPAPRGSSAPLRAHGWDGRANKRLEYPSGRGAAARSDEEEGEGGRGDEEEQEEQEQEKEEEEQEEEEEEEVGGRRRYPGRGFPSVAAQYRSRRRHGGQ